MYHIGFVPDFPVRNGCFSDECPVDYPDPDPNIEQTISECPGCRHRWEWLDKSVPTAGFHRWADDEPKIYSTTFRLCVAAQLDAVTGDYWWTTIVCNGDLALYVCKAGLCKFELHAHMM